MDKLIEFFTTKNGLLIFLTLVLGFFMPGILFIFGFNRNLFFELDIARLLILAGSIAFSIYIAVFIFVNIFSMLKEKYQKEEIDISEVIFKPIAITDICMYIGIYYRINENINSMKEFVNWFTLILLGLMVVTLIMWIPYIIYIKIKNKK